MKPSDSANVYLKRFRRSGVIATDSLGQSWFGAEDSETGKACSLLCLKPGLLILPAFRERLQESLEQTHSLFHESVLASRTLYHSENWAEAAIKWGPIPEGFELLSDKVERDGPIPADQFLPAVNQMISALESAHQIGSRGVVHGDLRPENIFYRAPEKSPRSRCEILIAGFQVSRLWMEELRKAGRGRLKGKPLEAYLSSKSPEQLESLDAPPREPYDYFAVGAVALFALTGERLVQEDLPGRAATKIRQVVSRGFSVNTHLKKSGNLSGTITDKWDRYIQDLLSQNLEASPESEPEIPQVPELPKQRRRPVWAIVGGVVALAAVSAFAFWKLGSDSSVTPVVGSGTEDDDSSENPSEIVAPSGSPKSSPTNDPPSSDLLVSPESAARLLPFENSLGMKFIPIPGRRNILICVHETRNSDFNTYLEAEKPGASAYPPDEYPKYNVSRDDAVEFCRWLTTKERRRDSVLEGDETALVPPGAFYRLPTFEEWQAAAGEGTFPWGDDWPPPIVPVGGGPASLGIVNLADKSYRGVYVAGYDDGHPTLAKAVEPQFRDPRNGLYHMGGNVWEWVSETSRESTGRVVGGSYLTSPRFAFEFSHHQAANPRGKKINDTGFRLVLILPEKEKEMEIERFESEPVAD